MSAENKWKGRTRGSLLGHKIFIFILKVFGLRVSYFILRFVAAYFFFFAKSTRSVLSYFKTIHGLSGWRLYRAAYQNYYRFGQVLIDKFAILSGTVKNYEIIHEGYEEHLKVLREKQSGSILLSAHVGNWEIAGQKLERLETKFNVLMYDNEVEAMKHFESKTLSKKNFNIIPIHNDDMSHIIELHKAFQNREILVMHGDRFLEGAETITKKFLGRVAKFPAGPFILASKFSVPLTIVFSMKEGFKNYHFYAFPPIQVARGRTKEELQKAVNEASDIYIRYLEDMVLKYPEQWFNFYDFWA
jgi:predicted LPLAT superfamily acyltransferase